MKIQTKNSVFDLELDGISSKGKIKFADGSKMKLREISNWIDVLGKFAEDVLCFDFVSTSDNSILLKEGLYFDVSDNDIIGNFSGAIELLETFRDCICLCGVNIEGFRYSVNNESARLVIEMLLSLD